MQTRFIVSAIIAGLIGTAGIARADHELESEGWTLLGEVGVDEDDRSDWIEVPHRARYDKLAIVVVRGEVNIEGLTVRYANGKGYSPRLRYEHFDRYTQAPLIDLPGRNGRRIDSIELDFEDRRRGRYARVQVWALDAEQPSGFDDGAWERVTTGRARDGGGVMTVRLDGRRYSSLAFDADPGIRISSVVVAYSGGRRKVFRPYEGEAPVIELGDHRRIRAVMIRYVNRDRYGDGAIALYGMR
jgi:hypothetical protein